MALKTLYVVLSLFCLALSTYASDQKSIRLNFLTKGIELEKTKITKNKVSLILDNKSHSAQILKLYKNKRPLQYISLKTRQTQTIDIKVSSKDLLEIMPLSPASEIIRLN